MRYLVKCGFSISNSNSCTNLFNSQILPPRVAQLVSLSTLIKQSSNYTLQHPNNNNKKLDKKSDPNNPGFGPLFSEILAILGTENITVDKDAPYGFLISEETPMKVTQSNVESSSLYQLQGVCENAQEKKDAGKIGNISVLENEGNGVLELEDVSPIVHKVTEIVRSESGMLPMEERLENADYKYDEEVVEKVLKRCFKVPHLALKFFNWVKLGNGFRHTADTFNVMINIAGEAKEFGLVEELADGMEKNSCEKNVKTWTILVSHYGKAKLIGKALSVFEKMKKAGIEPDGIAYRIMLQALSNTGKAHLALEFYKEMVHNEVGLDVGLYKQLLKCFALSGYVSAVHLVGDNMIRVSEVPENCVYRLMLKSFCVAGRMREALELIRDLKNKNVSLDTEIFETLVKGLCSMDRISDAMEIVEIMKKRNVFGQDIYGILISTYLRRNQTHEALNLFQDVKKSGNVSVSTYTNLMQHLLLKNEFKKSIELYNEMLKKGIQLDSVAITAIAAGYVRENCISEACEVFKSMDKKGIKPTSKSYTILIKELCKVSKTDEIVKVLNEMQARKVNISDDIFRHVLSYLEKRGETKKLKAITQMQRGFTFYSRVKDEPDVDPCDPPVSIGKSESNHIAPIKLLDTLPGSEPRFDRDQDIRKVCKILSSSTKWCFIEGELEKCFFQVTPNLVVEILRNCTQNIGTALKFFSWIGKKTGYSHNEESYNMAMKIAGQGKDFKKMRSLFYEMKRRRCSITSDTWTIMIMQYGRTGLTNIALSNFREMKLSGCSPTKSTYNYLITFLCAKKGRNIEEAICIYREMIQVGFAPDKKLVETYVGCLCEVKKLSDARSCIESLHKFGFSIPLSYSLYFRALCRAGKLDDALALMDEIGSERNLLDQYTYGSLVHGLLRRGQLEEALAKVKSMKQLGLYPTVHVYTDLIIHFFKKKEIDRALETLEEMKERGCQPTIVTYSAVICGYVRLGKISDAWVVFHHLKQNGPSPDFKTYSMFIDCLCRIGKSEEAFKLVTEMLHNGIIPSTINFQKIIYGLNREGKPNLAEVVLKKKLNLGRRRKMVTQHLKS
ncbi:hypothetical protein BUALT_Bualt08G0008700 [Buddleja alternifolia]|uniref:Pentatricopeptide repeat-containing protein n=1 Tax=Buddleja alternifolia TaxID=168488 RepID=A0AAV6XDP1_9LAMI|nr:hypothetical protein BUALT_Bualt08G0008700 [Buddleja alternifolia]